MRTRGPDRRRALELYRRHAPHYDRTGWVTARLRHRAVSILKLRPGDVVLDIGCGTGLSLPFLRNAVGDEGRVIGVELSPEMAAQAQRRIEEAGWTNVTLVNAPAEEAEIPISADAALFFLTHDVMRSPKALTNVLSHVKGGARVVAFGAKLAPWWAFPLNLLIWLFGSPYVTTYEGARRPWSLLAELIGGMDVRQRLAGCVYYASGTVS